MSQVQILGPRFRSQVLENVLDLGPKARKWSQNQDLNPKKGPRFRPQVQDLGPMSQKMSQIQIPGPRFRSQVHENVLGLDSRSGIQVLGPRKCRRFRSCVLGLCPSNWKSSYNQVLRPRKGPGFSQQVLEKVLDLGLFFLHFCPRSQ